MIKKNTTPRNSEKYLLLMQPEERFPALLNSQRFNLMEMLLLCKKTGRIFVLPPILSQPRDNSIAEMGETNHKKFVLGEIFFPMEQFFDIEKLKGYVDIMKFEEFVKISKGKLSSAYCFGKPRHKNIKSYNKNFSLEKVFLTKDVRDIFKSDEQFIAISGYSPGRYLVKSFPSWPKNFEEEYWKITRHMKYNRDLIKKAEKFIQSNDLGGYIAVHWRRGDRVHPEVSELAEQIVNEKLKMKRRLDKFLIKPIKEFMRKYKLNKVFLATNSGTEWHLEYLKSKLPIVQYSPSGNWKDREEESIIEQIICVKSDYFFAAPFHYEQCSNFSRWIIDFRILAGKGKMYSHQLKMRQSFFVAKLHLFKEKLLLKIRPFLKRVLPKKLQRLFVPFYVWLKK